MADNPYKIKNQGTQQVKGNPTTTGGKTEVKKGNDLRAR